MAESSCVVSQGRLSSGFKYQNMNCKFSLLFLFCCALVSSGVAQEHEEDATNVAKITLLNPGVGYEARIGHYQTISGQLFMNLSTYAEDGGSRENIRFYFDPAATLQYRYYYNGGKRAEAGKRIEKNSMNYVAAVGEVFFSRMPLTVYANEENSRRPVYRLGAVWGLQRNFEKHFSLDVNIGPGILSSTETFSQTSTVKHSVSQVTLMGQLNLGFWF